jgi:RNA polymerase sigma-70 factor (ECF subfamily)
MLLDAFWAFPRPALHVQLITVNAQNVQPKGDVTKLLIELRSGNPNAESQLIALVYSELRRIAHNCMRSERQDHTLQPTELVSEAYLRLVGQHDKEWQNRAHFYAVAAQIMRRILVDYARARKAEKRGGNAQKINIDDIQVAFDIESEELLDVDAALTRLAQWDHRQSRVVEMRIFGGLTEEEIAAVLDVAVRTVKRDFRHARAWLRGELLKDDHTSKQPSP